MLIEAALRRLTVCAYNFCPDAHCDTVYFEESGSCFTTADLRVPVFQKLPAGTRQICYCFGESEASIRAEVESVGTSLAAERIRAHIAEGRCACDLRNPRGACCLGAVIAAVAQAQGAHGVVAGAASPQPVETEGR